VYSARNGGISYRTDITRLGEIARRKRREGSGWTGRASLDASAGGVDAVLCCDGVLAWV
jgi:hypothetical protein